MKYYGIILLTASGLLLLAGTVFMISGNNTLGQPVFYGAMPIALFGFSCLGECHYRDKLVKKGYLPQVEEWWGQRVTHYRSSNQEEDIKDAMRQILCSDWGLTVSLTDRARIPAAEEVSLILRREVRCGALDDAFVLKVMHSKEFVTRTYKNPQEAIDGFLEVWRNCQVGEHWTHFNQI